LVQGSHKPGLIPGTSAWLWLRRKGAIGVLCCGEGSVGLRRGAQDVRAAVGAPLLLVATPRGEADPWASWLGRTVAASLGRTTTTATTLLPIVIAAAAAAVIAGAGAMVAASIAWPAAAARGTLTAHGCMAGGAA
jgi:hypothetical protein